MLVVKTHLRDDSIVGPDDPVEFYTCAPENGDCQLIEGSRTIADFTSALPSDASSQIALHIGE